MSNKKSNKQKKVNSKISSTKKMNENNIKDVKEALKDDVKKTDIDEVIQKNIEKKIEEVKEPEESIIVEQEEADSSEELVEQDFYKSEVLEKIKTELKSKKKQNSKSRKRKLILLNFIVGAIVELFFFGALSVIMWVPQDFQIIVRIIRLVIEVLASLILLELGYHKKKTLYFIYGVEFFAVTILDLLIINTCKNNEMTDVYNLFIIIAASVAIYYIIRAFVINITYKNVDDTEKK